MRDFEIVVATDAQRGIGKGGKFPWNLPGDMKFFRDLTTKTTKAGKENAVIMGRRTWDSIPSRFRPLPGRINLVLSRDKDIKFSVETLHAQSFEEGLSMLDKPPLKNMIERVFVIGGGQIYQEALKRPECKILHITQLLDSFDCDAYFPPYHVDFERVNISRPVKDGNITYFYTEYRRQG